MIKASFRIVGLACALVFAGAATSQAQHLIYRGITTVQWERLNYVGSSGATKERGSEKLHEIYIYSSLSNPVASMGYARYTLDLRNKVATKKVGAFTGRPISVAAGSGLAGTVEKHTQLNANWTEDIPDVGVTDDIWNSRTGDFGGLMSQIYLPTSGSWIHAARKLSGTHVHTSWSELFGIDARPGFGYMEGRFHQVSNSKGTFKLDLPLTGQAKVLGGSLVNAITVTDADLTAKGFSIVLAGPP